MRNIFLIIALFLYFNGAAQDLDNINIGGLQLGISDSTFYEIVDEWELDPSENAIKYKYIISNDDVPGIVFDELEPFVKVNKSDVFTVDGYVIIRDGSIAFFSFTINFLTEEQVKALEENRIVAQPIIESSTFIPKQFKSIGNKLYKYQDVLIYLDHNNYTHVYYDWLRF